MSILRSPGDSIISANTHAMYPQPTQTGQWDSTAPFMVQTYGEDYQNGKSPKQFVDDLRAYLPSNVNMRDYVKYNSPTQAFDPTIPDSAYTMFGMRANNAPEKLYATVEIDGHIVAKLFNDGSYDMPDLLPTSMPDAVRQQFAMRLSADRTGPQLAQKRAEEIAAAFGGEIHYAGTAQTQNEWGQQIHIEWGNPVRMTNKQAWLQQVADYAHTLTGGTALDAQLFGQSGDVDKADKNAA